MRKEIKNLDGLKVVIKVEENLFKRLFKSINYMIKEGITLGNKYRNYRYFRDYRVGTTWRSPEDEDVKLIGKTADCITLLIDNDLQYIIVK